MLVLTYTGKWHLAPFNSNTRTYAENQDAVKDCGYDFVDALYMENLDAHKPSQGIITDGTYSHNMEFVTHEAIRFINNKYEDADTEASSSIYYCPSLLG